jgi:hypothetical protein
MAADLLRNLMSDHSHRCGDPERNRGKEGGCDHHADHEVVEGIADQDQRTCEAVYLALVIVAMTPEHQFFQHEEQHHPEQHRCHDRDSTNASQYTESNYLE